MTKSIAYLISRFPKVTETFILYEILELEKLGTKIEIFPLVHQQEPIRHAEAAPLVARAHYTRWYSWRVGLAQLQWLVHAPRRYLGTWAKVVWHNRGSVKFLSRAIVVMPLASYFAWRMRQLDVEHIHAHWATHPTLAAYIIHHLIDLPYSFTAHAHDIYVDQTMLREKMTVAQAVVTISDYNHRFLTEHGADPSKLNVIHCGIDLSIFQPRQPSDDDHLQLICVASLEDKKGHRYLLAACHLLMQAGIKFTCWLVGDGEERSALEAQVVELGLVEQVQFWGRQPRETVSQLLQTADVMVLPSIITASGKKEGIPVALMEALATELPVIATDISGISELVIDGETGLLVPEKDAQAIFAAILKLRQDPAFAQQLGKAGRHKVMAEFNLATCVRQLFDLIVAEEEAE